jgi:UDP-N-acetylglucosamine/UDP-N-acetylgalactosamine diphosphorylase
MAAFTVPDDLRQRYVAAGQEQVFKFIDEGKVDAAAAESLTAALGGMDIERVNELYASTMADASAESVDEPLEPFPEVASIEGASAEDKAAWSNVCVEALSRGEVGVILLAGGQGTRLGFDRPKGEYILGLPSRKTLFQLQAQRIQRLQEMASKATGVENVRIPWYIMTSPMTDTDTREHFQEVNNYGIAEEDIVFFQQGTLPCLTMEGKVMLETGSSVAKAPDGNGGIYMGLHTSGAMGNMEARGVKFIFVYAVDNAASRVADPLFVGYCIQQGADVGVKTTPKANALEKIGVLCMKGDSPAVVEYSDIKEADAQATNEDGSLRLSTGSICIHYYSFQFLNETCSPASLPKVYHVAKKAIPYAHPETGATVPKSELPGNTGMKLESFIFDVFPMAKNMAVMQCVRAQEFSPVKNAPGNPVDSPDSALAITATLHKGWLEAAGAVLEGEGIAEVSPLVSYAGEGLQCLAGVTLKLPVQVVLSSEGGEGPEVSDEPNQRVLRLVQ